MFSSAEKIKYLFKGHIANWFWRDREKRRIVRNEAYSELIISYLKKYIPYIKTLSVPDNIKEDLNINIDNKPEEEKVYSVWLQGIEQAPYIVQKCIESIKNFYGEQFLLIEEKDIPRMVRIPDLVIEKFNSKLISPAHFVDIVRLELLYHYGGFWMDSTNFMTDKIPQKYIDMDFFMHMAGGEYSYVFIQNYFIRAKRHDPLLYLWKQLLYKYWETEDKAVDYFFAQYLFKLLVTHNAEATRLFNKMPKIDESGTQLLWLRFGNEPFDKEKYKEMRSKSFFQKCSYKKRKNFIQEIKKGSMADYVINHNGK